MEASKCPKCGEEPCYLEHVEKWYCYGCNAYVEEDEKDHVCAPEHVHTEECQKAIADEIKSLEHEEPKAECKKCGAELQGLKDGKLFCFVCETYQDEVQPPPETKPQMNEAQALLDLAKPPEEPKPAPLAEEAKPVPEPAPAPIPAPVAVPKVEHLPDIRSCPSCGQPLKFIEKYSRYYCYGCRKYAPREDVPKPSPPAHAKATAPKACPDCGGELKFVDKYSEYYCYKCKKYPFHIKAKAGTQKAHVCHKCGQELKWIEKYQRHYCLRCKEYAPKAQSQSHGHPPQAKVCPACKGSMKFIPEYNEWYCYGCKRYSLRPSKPVLLM
jgi:predicted RNA-binding Zn-ribbon protein involved in translation (DUF1610 family)